ncbi:DUF4279 domain-containing protein [Stenotrophomonas sp. JC08]|uniref:DUF4279 domain-containing protein n=1 Tax=Stenotrophomonas sp. JC08 TaxID=3445779 RepID=UPI003FA253E3
MSCLETYATLRIFSKSIEPETIGAMLGISTASCRPIDPSSKYRSRREWGLWSWCTDTIVESRDNLEHLRAITELLDGKSEQLAYLRAQNCQTDIFCYWVSSGQGGPYLDASTINALASLGLDISWDMYFGDEANYNEDGSRKSPHGA